MKLLRYADFLKFERIPFYSTVNSQLIESHSIQRTSSIVIFVSYVWYSNYASSTSSTEIISPSAAYAPDDPKSHKIYHLIKEGIEALVENTTSALYVTETYLWLDCACMDISDGSIMKKQMSLDEIINNCDCLLTPLVHVDHFFFEMEEGNLYNKVLCGVYRNWIGSPSSYLSRSWCRLEFWYGMVLPYRIGMKDSSSSSSSSPSDLTNRLECFKGNFVDCIKSNHRPHYLFGKDEMDKSHLFLLPRISLELFDEYLPSEGFLTHESDRILIQTETIIVKNYLNQLLIGYEGELQKGLKHGKGLLVYKDGSSYEGDWKNDVKDGKGKFIFPNGDVYEGDFQNDCIEGEGKLIYVASGNICQGIFKNNLVHGIADYNYKDGNYFHGEYIEGKRHGFGRYTFVSGGFYEGEFQNDMRHGKGVYFYENGCKYEGDFFNDHRHGIGKYYYSNGDVYEGEFQNGHYNGNGKYYSKNGHIYDGQYKDDKKHGKGKLIYKTGEILEMEFYEGKEIASSLVVLSSSNSNGAEAIRNNSSTVEQHQAKEKLRPMSNNPRSSFCVLN